jgi:hypothetical protein
VAFLLAAAPNDVYPLGFPSPCSCQAIHTIHNVSQHLYDQRPMLKALNRARESLNLDAGLMSNMRTTGMRVQGAYILSADVR